MFCHLQLYCGFFRNFFRIFLSFNHCEELSKVDTSSTIWNCLSILSFLWLNSDLSMYTMNGLFIHVHHNWSFHPCTPWVIFLFMYTMGELFIHVHHEWSFHPCTPWVIFSSMYTMSDLWTLSSLHWKTAENVKCYNGYLRDCKVCK